jgi:3-oxoacyl-[acyl-carrier-protein] synthase II
MHEVWVTGIGLVTALGTTREETWSRLVGGESGIGPLTVFDPTGFRIAIAAQVDDTALELPAGIAHRAARWSRASRMGIAAAIEAIGDAGLTPEALPAGTCLVFGGGAAGLLEAEAFIARRLSRGPRARGLREIIEVPQDSASDRVAEVLALDGQRITVTTACSSSTIAVGMAADLVAAGDCEVALAGGPDALCRLTYAGFSSLRAASPEPARPFDIRRRGLTLGEGAAVLVLESRARAERRGTAGYARVLGYGVTNDAFHMTQPEPTGAAWERTVRTALAASGRRLEDVDYVNAHGTGTEQNDPAESSAYRLVFGDRLASIPVSSIKGAVGHCLCAAGGIEAAVTALAIARGIAPPTAGLEQPDPACVPDAIPGRGRAVAISTALSSSFAFGGNSAALVLGRLR